MKVVDPDGRTWDVRRRWAPAFLGRETLWERFARRFRRMFRHSGDALDGADAAEGCLSAVEVPALVLAGIALLLLAFVVLPVLIATLELLALVVIGGGALVARWLFRHPWTIDVVGPPDRYHAFHVVGWQKSERARRQIVQSLRDGRIPVDGDL